MDGSRPLTTRTPNGQAEPLDPVFIARLRQEVHLETVPDEDFDLSWVGDCNPEPLKPGSVSMWRSKNGTSAQHPVGATQPFVRSRGFQTLGDYAALDCEDGTNRLFAELTADPDRPEVRPQEAYQSLLASLQPGWSLRLLQLLWPDPEPRQAFPRAVARWGEGPSLNEGMALLQKGMELNLLETPPPFSRKVYLEFVYAGEESLAWWAGLPDMLGAFFVRFRPLDAEEIQSLVSQAFHPELG